MTDAWIIEVGTRAALHAESRPRDLRWFRGLFPAGRGNKKEVPF